jgi:DNA-binding FadR family transcriptional regulator
VKSSNWVVFGFTMKMRPTDQDLIRLRKHLQHASLSHQERLPPERELAETLGITRNRLRTGLKKLAAEGLIWRHVGKGTFFGQRLQPASGSYSANQLHDLTNPREVMTARLAIEPPLARLASVHATGRELLEIGRCLDQMAIVKEWDDWEQLDLRLHRLIAEAANNALMLVMFDTVQVNRNRKMWGRLRQFIGATPAIELAMREHAEIVAALQNRDSEMAESAMRSHLLGIESRMFGSN